MNYYAIVPFFTFLFEGFTCTYIIAQESKNPVNRAYLIMALAIMFWGLFDMMIWTHDSDFIASVLINISSVTWLSIGLLFLNFTYVLLKRKKDWFFRFTLILTIIACCISVTTKLVCAGMEPMAWGRFMKHGPLFFPFVFSVITIPFLYSFFLIFKSYKKTSDEHRIKQLKLILYGTAIAFFAGIYLDVFVPYVFGKKDFIQIGGLPSLIHTVFIFMAITRYKFLKIGIQEAASDLFSNVKDGLVLMDNNQKIIQINESACKILKLENEKYLEPEQISIEKYLDGYSFNQDYNDYQIKVKLRGELKYLCLSQSVLYENNLSIGKMLLIRDVTEAKKAEMMIIDKNKKITDSINYAQRIQDAILPSMKHLSEIFPDSFIFYQPKDVVSGDFPWLKIKNGYVYLSAVDCTGHGVPGALMSMIGHFQLDSIIAANKAESPADILYELHQGVNKSLKQVDNLELSDGMDLAFCKIDMKNKNLEFAGAHRPMLLLRNNEIIHIKGNRFPIGGMQYSSKGIEIKFNNNHFEIKKGDAIFIYTDGLPDQIGGDNGRRFMQKRIEKNLLNCYNKPMYEIKNIIINEFMNWKAGRKQLDDVLMIGLRF